MMRNPKQGIEPTCYLSVRPPFKIGGRHPVHQENLPGDHANIEPRHGEQGHRDQELPAQPRAHLEKILQIKPGEGCQGKSRPHATRNEDAAHRRCAIFATEAHTTFQK